MERVIVFYRKRDHYWGADIYANAFVECFNELGIRCQSVNESLPVPNDLTKKDFVFSLGISSMHHFTNPRWARAGKFILYNINEISEGPGWEKSWNANLRTYQRICGKNPDFIFDYAPTNRRILDAHGLENTWCPMGYHKSFEKLGKGIRPDTYDIGFLGTAKGEGRRVGILEELKKRYRLVYVGFDNRDFKSRNKVKARAPEVLGASVFMNIWRCHTSRNPRDMATICWAMSNKRCLLQEAEPSWHPPFGNDVHWVVRQWGSEFHEAIQWLLNYPEKRMEIAEEAYWFIKNKWRLIDHLKASIEELKL